MSAEQCIEILLRSTRAINIRYGLIDHAVCLQIVHIPEHHRLQYHQHLMLRGRRGIQETAIRQALMGIDSALCLYPVCGKDRQQLIIFIDEQGAVGEAVGVIIHETAFKQERAVLGLSDKRIPFVSQLWCVLYEFHDKDTLTIVYDKEKSVLHFGYKIT